MQKSPSFAALPPPLLPGSQIGIAATARPVSQPELAEGFRFWTENGYKVGEAANLWSREAVFAGNDAERLAGLQALLDDPALGAIHFARGGYGTLRILERLNWEGFARSPKWLIGYSDLTALLNYVPHLGWATVHGPMAFSLSRNPFPEDLQALLGLLQHQGLTATFQAEPGERNQLGKAVGPVVGGNLCVLSHTLGTPFQPNFEGAILFIEEVDEYRYRVDRMLQHLALAGVFSLVSGLVVGSFTQIHDNPEPFGMEIREMVYHAAGKSLPIAFGFPAGHGERNFPLLIGSRAELEVREGEASLRWA